MEALLSSARGRLLAYVLPLLAEQRRNKAAAWRSSLLHLIAVLLLRTRIQPVTLSSEILNLVHIALDNFETSPLDASARRALRIAQLRGDVSEAWFLRTDLRPIGGAVELRIAEITSLFRDAEYSYIREMDSRLREVWIQERMPERIPEPLSELMPYDKSVIVGSIADLQRQRDNYDSEKQTQEDPRLRIIMEQRASLTAEIIERIRFRVFSYLCRVETELNFSLTSQDVFERHRQRVDRHLSELASDVLQQFTAAYRRMNEGDIEARTHALTSCRRILKSVADIAYPAKAQPVIDNSGRSRDVSDDKYVNRLWQFVDDTIVRKTIKGSMHATLTDLGNRIDRLYNLACKGVHDEVSNDEVEWCVVQTYILAGEILRLMPVEPEQSSEGA